MPIATILAPARRVAVATIATLSLTLAGPSLMLIAGKAELGGNWAAASHRSIGSAPSPATTPEAVLQVYAARAFSWRGAFAVHTWIAAKPENADRYTRYEVIGFRLRRGLPVVSVSSDRAPDAEWFSARPVLIQELRGDEAAAVIGKLSEAAARYPYADRYSAWPGPNSNTFIAWLGREIPEMDLVMPPLAVGKDWLGDGIVAQTPAGGWQVSLGGVAGILVGDDEGIEVNLLGLVFGASLDGPSISVPGIGRIGSATDDAW